MPTPPPEPSDRQPPGKSASGSGERNASRSVEPEGLSAGPPPRSSAGSTDSHHQKPEASLSDLIRSSGSSRRNPSSDILQLLANPGSSPINPQASAVPAHGNTDDAPTVITQNRPPYSPPPPLPLTSSGENASLANRRLGHFELIEAIGSGGMAAVLKARDLELGRIVALKILPPEAARDPESVTRFKQEARAAAMLDHDNVARVYYCGEDQGLHFIAFEFVEGDNLRVLIERRGTIAPGDCIRYMIQVAAGLNHAADRGVVHRDIKPSNIIITPDGRAKIVDMGLARHLDSLMVNGGVTQSGVTLGTFDYISPEQALDPRRADVRSDIYSLGCAFYHASTGRPPVPEGTAAKKLYAHQHIDPVDPRLLNPAIPDGLAAVLSGMMAKNPDQRFQTPTDLIAHLKGVMEQLKLGADGLPKDSVVQAVPANQSPLPDSPYLRTSWLLGAAAVVVVATAFALSTGDSGPRPTAPSWVNEGASRKEDSASSSPTVGTLGQGTSADDRPAIVKTAQQLHDSLATSNGRSQKLQLGPGEFKLLEFNEGIEYSGKELELIGASNGTTRIVLPTPSHGGLTFKVESLLIRDVRFEFRPDAAAIDDFEAPGIPVGISVLGASQVTLQDCSFHFQSAQIGPIQAADEAIAVAVGPNLDSPQKRVSIVRCAFASLGVALQVPTFSELQVEDSGFYCRKSAIQVLNTGAMKDEAIESSLASTVKLSRSSFAVEPGSAVVDAASSCEVTAGYCVFSADGKAQASVVQSPYGTVLKISSEDPRAWFKLTDRAFAAMRNASVPESVLLKLGPLKNKEFSRRELARETARLLNLEEANQYQDSILKSASNWFSFAGISGQKNAYYRVNPIAVSIGSKQTLTFEECKLNKLQVEDKDAVALAQRPWHEADLLRYSSDKDPWSAFGLRIASEPAVFVDESPKVIGAQFHNPARPSRRAYPPTSVTLWPPLKPRPMELAQKVWYPQPEKNEVLPIGTSDDLLSLLRTSRPDDVIFIKHDGLLSIPETIELKARGSADFRITFKAAPGCKPILAAPNRGENLKLDQPLFRLMNGDVAFEGIQFLLKPPLPKNPFKVAAVTIVGGRSCSFNDCVFTLAEEDERIAAAVMVEDPEKIMAMPEGANRPVPEIAFNKCVIRGKGRGVWIEVSRAVKVEVVQSLLAIDGPLLLAEPAGKFVAGAKSNLKISRTTAFLGGPLMELKGGRFGEMRASGLVPFEVHADDCLFAAVPGAGLPILELDGIDAAEVRSLLEWQVKGANVYANFDESAPVVVLRSSADGTSAKEWDWNQWLSFTGEPPANGKPIVKLSFALAPSGLRELASIKPRDIKLSDASEMKADDTGANWKGLPNPWSDDPKPE